MRLTESDSIRNSIDVDVLETVDDVQCWLGAPKEKLSLAVNRDFCEIHLYVKYKDPATDAEKRGKVAVEFSDSWSMRTTYLDCILDVYAVIKQHQGKSREILFKCAASYITRYCKSFIGGIDFEVYDVKSVEK